MVRISSLKFFSKFDLWILTYAFAAFVFSKIAGFKFDASLIIDFRYDHFFLLGLLEFTGVYAIYAAFSLFRRKADKDLFGPAWRKFITQDYVTLQRLVDALHAMVGLKILLAMHALIKQSIPLINPSLFDETLLSLDILIHGGINPMKWSVNALHEHGVSKFIDICYVAWYQLKVPILFVFIAHPNRSVFERFYFAYFAMWVLGGLLTVLVPSVGPLYIYPEWFHGTYKPLASALQEQLWAHYQELLKDPTHYLPHSYEGVAAFPSLHVGIAALFSFFIFDINKYFGLFLIIYTALIEVGSVYLGWHYAIDGYFGIALAYLLYSTSRHLKISA